MDRFMLSRLGVTAVLVAVCNFSWSQEVTGDAAEIKRGEYLAVASDCDACHSAPGGKHLAGGLPIESPLGAIYSTNITPSKQYGIGNYSLQQFSDALRRGIRADGAHLYPAMPYDSYAFLTDEDVKSLYAYFTKAVPAVDEPPAKGTALPFPYNLRFSMVFWNALFLNTKPFTPDPSKSAEWNRGKYLVEGATHCGECHTPRGFFMQQDRSRDLSGAVLTSWYAPNITPDPKAGIGAMSADELFQYLKFGKVAGKAQAAGDMALAVQLSFSKLSDEDLRAIVTYIRSVPAHGEAGARAKFSQGGASTEVATFRGIGGTSSDGTLPGGPAQLFAANCASCHGIEAGGSRDRYFPSLFNNSALAEGGGRNLVAAILFGVDRTTANGFAFMPGFGGKATDIAALSNEQVAQLANYLLRQYGDTAYTVRPGLVQEVRRGQAPKPPLALLVEVGKWGGALLLLLVLWPLGRYLSRTRVWLPLERLRWATNRSPEPKLRQP
jgi:mono/diheme cytochrome c family protein